ncbi:hypothetical protein [Risungbinella massiliensis]|uniref:hypothetical protein n=1 Tax=Risungbinella massiliensis TaxID=1329796 RepID=UPI0005CC2426|nr:hypothetical protein [Risungbinella massiliensis]
MEESYRKRIEKLELEVSCLKEAIFLLTTAKAVNPDFAYHDWIIRNGIFDEKRVSLEWVLYVLESRIRGEKPFQEVQMVQIPNQYLYRDQKPSRKEITDLCLLVLEMEDQKVVDELFSSLEKQDVYRNLVSHYGKKRE